MHETDEQLYRRFLKERNEDDLRVLLERHRESLMFFLYGYVHDMEDAEELMMDSFAVAASGKSGFAGKSSFKTWLFSIGHNLARMHVRKRRITSVPIEDGMDVRDAEAADPEASVLNDERSRQLYSAMGMMNAKNREILYLLYFEDMGYDEIAQVIRKSRRQTYRVAERCRMQLKNLLEKQGFDYSQL